MKILFHILNSRGQNKFNIFEGKDIQRTVMKTHMTTTLEAMREKQLDYNLSLSSGIKKLRVTSPSLASET